MVPHMVTEMSDGIKPTSNAKEALHENADLPDCTTVVSVPSEKSKAHYKDEDSECDLTPHEKDKILQKEWEEKISQQSNRASTSSTHSHDSRRSQIERIFINNHAEYREYLKNYDTTKSLYIFFCGSNSPNSGYSWSQNCVKAVPLIEEALKYVHNSIFLTVPIGLKDEWEDKLNPYREDKCLKLKIIPTLYKYKTPRRLEGVYCLKPELLELLFENDTDDF